MTSKEISQKASRISADLSRERALEKYYKDPAICKCCNKIIEVPDDKKPSDIKRKKFCNSSCAATYNNTISPKRKTTKEGKCEICGTTIQYTKYDTGEFYRKKYCDECGRIVRTKNLKNTKINTSKTIADLKKQDPNNWRTAIRSHARTVYSNNQKKHCCEVCGYDKHIEIHHIKEVSLFPYTATLEEINSLDNLIGLCPNHHWEIHAGVLEK